MRSDSANHYAERAGLAVEHSAFVSGSGILPFS